MEAMKIAILDSGTLGDDLDFSIFERFGRVEEYKMTDERQVQFRAMDVDIIIVNKVKLNAKTLGRAEKLKLICVTATGYDNIDLDYCRSRGIGVCNVKGYSTDSVSQLTMSMALSLATNLTQFHNYVKSREYSNSGVQNHLTPVFHELSGMTWGVVGLGSIGKKVAKLASAFGCEVLCFKRSSEPGYKCVSLEELCERSDIISIHLPLTDKTRNIINADMIGRMKRSAIVINVARGAVTDEAALAEAIESKKIGGLGVDVYSKEPLELTSPYIRLLDNPNVILTPHMAWGAYEARVRCMEEIVGNIEVFLHGGRRNRVEL